MRVHTYVRIGWSTGAQSSLTQLSITDALLLTNQLNLFIMNTRSIIACLVGGFILFIWQFVSNTFGGIHTPNQQYVAGQDAIMAAINANITETGTYMIPNVPATTSMDEKNKFMEAGIGKPQAEIHYIKDTNFSFVSNLLRGYLADIVAVAFLVFWVFSNYNHINIKNGVLTCLGVGLAYYLTTHYLGNVWYQKNSIPELIDAVVAWSLCGAWLGYYLRRDIA
jgi:hypothetical protein